MRLSQDHKKIVVFSTSIFILASLVRTIYFFDLKASPFFLPLQNGLDPQIYTEWAMRIANGDWIGDGIFIGMPLYSYFLGIIFLLFKNSISAAITIQLLLSSLNCVLIFLIAKRLFNLRIAAIAGIIASLYLPFLFNDAMLTASVLITFLNYLGLYLLLRYERYPSWRYIIIAGIVIGLATLARATTLLFLPCIVLWIIFAFLELSIRKRLISATVLVLCVGMVILPVTVRNYVVTHEKILITPYGGINFYIGNNPGADGWFSPPKGMRPDSLGLIEDAQKMAERILNKKLTLTQTSDFWVKNTLSLMRENPWSTIKLMIKKCGYFWNGYEMPDILNYYFFKSFVPLLRLPLFSFVVIGPLGFLGLILSLKGKRDLFVVYAFLVSYTMAIILLFINSRYRLTITPIMIIFSAFSLNECFIKCRQKEYRWIRKYAVVLLGLFVFVNMNIEKRDYSPSYNNLGMALYEQGKIKEAEAAYLKSVEIRPTYAAALNNLGAIYFRQGDKEKAREFFQRAIDLDPEHPSYLRNRGLTHDDYVNTDLALAYSRTGDLSKAIEIYQAIIKSDPKDVTANVNLANIYLKQKKLDEALREYKKALEKNPDLVMAHYNLGVLYFMRGELDLAKKEWEVVLELNPEFAPAKQALEKLALP